MHRIIVLIFVFLSRQVGACECPELTALSKEVGDAYDVVFLGEVDSVKRNEGKGGVGSVAFFNIKEAYKGDLHFQTQVYFDDTTSCMMSFSSGDIWIIYADYMKFDQLVVSICSHSRKYFERANEDYYLTTSTRSFQEEIVFLQKTFQVQPFVHRNELNEQQEKFGRNNIQPEPMNKLFLLLVSLGVMTIVFIVIKKIK